MIATPLLFPANLLGWRVRVFFAKPVDLGGGILLARVEGVLIHGLPATFSRRTFSLGDISFVAAPEGHDITYTAGLFCAFLTADVRNLAALEILLPAAKLVSSGERAEFVEEGHAEQSTPIGV
jgi:hypothetical protein